jgi:hypothetical protein
MRWRTWFLSTAAGAVALVVLTAWGLRVARYEPETVEEQEPASELWRAAAGECLARDRQWFQGEVDGVLVGRCSLVPDLGVVAVKHRSRR